MAKTNSKDTRRTANKGSQKGSSKALNKRDKAPQKPTKYSDHVLVNKYENDPRYYNKYLTDYNAAMNFSWFNIIGRPVTCQGNGKYGDKVESTIAIPQIMRVDFDPTIGKATMSTDPINKCFGLIMAEVLAKTSTSDLGFQTADLAMEQICLATVCSLIGQLQRALQSTDFWITHNITYPKALLSSMGYDWDDLVNNKPKYQLKLNSIIHQVNVMLIPKFMDVIDRYYSMTNSIFVDEDDAYGQIYYFWQRGIYYYDDTQFKATYTKLPETKTSDSLFYDHLLIAEKAINLWYGSSDYYRINGALLRAFKDAEILKLADYQLTDTINPTVSKTFMQQLMNMDILGDMEDLDITQDAAKNSLICEPRVEVDSLVYGGTPTRHFIRSFDPDQSITIDDKCEMTRMCAYVSSAVQETETKKYYCYLESCGTDIVASVRIYSVDANNYAQSNLMATYRSNCIFVDNSMQGSASQLASAFCLQPFRYIPRMSVFWYEQDSSVTMYWLGDLYNYTHITNEQISQMNTVAMYSMWKPSLPALNDR